jgi:excisionase family DNA binding protein
MKGLTKIMDKLLSMEELAEILGVTKATIYSWTSQNKIPHIKLSKRLLKFREKDIVDWISKRAVNADRSSGNWQQKHSHGSSPSSNLQERRIERIIRNAKEEILNRR